MMGARGFRLTEDERTEMKTALEVAEGNKDYSLGLKVRSVLAVWVVDLAVHRTPLQPAIRQRIGSNRLKDRAFD